MNKLLQFIFLLTTSYFSISAFSVFAQALPASSSTGLNNLVQQSQQPALGISDALGHEPLQRIPPNKSNRSHAGFDTKKLQIKPVNSLRLSDPELPLKDTPVKELVLPGLMRIPGASAQMIDPTRGQVVEFANGGSSSVYASSSDINLIQLPFNSPLVTSTDGLEIKQSGSNIYFQFKPGTTKPIQLYVENQLHSSTVLSLQLIPKSIVSQVIRVVDNTGITASNVRQGRSNDYLSQIVFNMELVANNQNPQGFTKISLNNISPIILNGLVITPYSRLSSVDEEIFVYIARNPSPNIATLSEKEFGGESVLSVSIFPTPVLRQGDQTKIIVIARKQAATRPLL